MKKGSIFNFYLMIYSVFVLVGIIIIGTVMLFVSKEYYESEIEETYKSHCDALAGVLKPYGSDDYEVMSNAITYDATFYDMRAFVADSNGKIVIALDSEGSFIGKTLPENALPESDVKGVFLTDDLSGLFSDRMCSYTVMYYPKDSNETEPMYLMLYGSRDKIKSFNTMLYLVYTASSLFTMLFFLFVASKLLSNIIRPMTEITETARQYSQGDFSSRIQVKSSGEIAELSKVLNEMADSIDKNEKSRMAFIANVSHELRTPMTSIGGFVDAILSGTIPPESERHYLQIVSEEINRLSRLVRSMLYLSKYESNEMQINCSEFELRDLLINTVFLFETSINKKNVDVQGLDFEKITLYADKDLIQQVIYNLIENAVKFVDEKGVISFDVKKSGKNVDIAIRNTGEGISSDDLSRIFEKFYKTDASRGKDKTGVGLGLSIVRSIIALHKGTIRVSSQQGVYTQFDIDMPISQKNLK